MTDFFSSEALWAGVFVLVLGLNFASGYAERSRLKDWAESLGVKIVKKERGWHIDTAKNISRYVGKGGRAHRIVVQDSSHFAFTCCVFAGGIWASLRNRAPVVIWEGKFPQKKESIQPPAPTHGNGT